MVVVTVIGSRWDDCLNKVIPLLQSRGCKKMRCVCSSKNICISCRIPEENVDLIKQISQVQCLLVRNELWQRE